MKKKNLVNLAVLIPFVLSLFFYLLTVCPVVYVGDDGEIVSAAYTMGVAHPPGYPLFCLIGKIFSFLPLSNIAFRVNLAAVFFASLSSLFLFLLMRKIVSDSTEDENAGVNTAALCASLVFAFSLTFWTQSLHSKGGLYSLNIFLILAMFYMMVINRPYIFGLLLGLSLTNHHTAVLALPAFFVYICIYRKDWFNFDKVKYIVLLFLAGLSVYLYLIIRANAKPLMNWGDPYNIERALYHVFRKQYGEITKLAHTFGSFYDMSAVYAKWLLKQFTPFLIVLVPVGMYGLFKKDKKMFWILIMALLFSIFGMMYVLNYEINPRNIYVNEVFFIPSFLFASIFLGFGVYFLIEKFKIALFIAPLCVLLPLLSNFSPVNLKNNYIAYNYGINILKTIDRNSIFFTEGDNQMFILAYMQYVDKVRTDITVYDDIGSIFENIYGGNFLRIPKRERDELRNKIQKEKIEKSGRPVFIPLVGSKRELLGLFKKEQRGILYKVKKERVTDLSEDPFKTYDLAGIDAGYDDYLVRDIVAQYYFAMGDFYYAKGQEEKCLEYYEKCAKAGYDSEWVPNNLGVAYSEKGFKEKALEYTQKSISINPSSARDYTNLGVMYYQQGKYAEATDAYNKALELNRNYAEAYNGLGTVYGVTGRNDEAIKLYEAAISLKSDYAEAIANMGIVYHGKGQVDKAIELYNKAIGINPSYVDAYNNMGVAYESKGNLDKALFNYRKALELNPAKAEAYHNVGVIFFKQGKYIEAIEQWEKALALKPDYVSAKNNIELTRKRLIK